MRSLRIGAVVRRAAAGRWTRLALTFASVVVGGAMLAACSSGPSVPGVASLNQTKTSHHKDAKTKSYPHNQLGFALCMRAHGISNFPESPGTGPITITKGSDLSPFNARFRSAMNACRSVLGITPPTAAQQAQALAQGLKFSRCMRAHGVTNFPDPTAHGGFFVRIGGGLNPSNPVFQSAQRACSNGSFGRHLKNPALGARGNK